MVSHAARTLSHCGANASTGGNGTLGQAIGRAFLDEAPGRFWAAMHAAAPDVDLRVLGSERGEAEEAEAAAVEALNNAANKRPVSAETREALNALLEGKL